MRPYKKQNTLPFYLLNIYILSKELIKFVKVQKTTYTIHYSESDEKNETVIPWKIISLLKQEMRQSHKTRFSIFYKHILQTDFKYETRGTVDYMFIRTPLYQIMTLIVTKVAS